MKKWKRKWQNQTEAKHRHGVLCLPKYSVMELIWGSLQKIWHFSEVKCNEPL